MRRVAVIAAAVLVVFSARQATADEPSVFPLRKVVLQLKWRHQFQFAGYYAAKAQGYYAKAGLDVEIVPGAPDVVTVNEVISGRADFGVGGAELVLEYALGRDVVMLATIFQHSPSVLLVRSDRGILSPHDLAMRRVMLERGLASADILALLAAEGLDEQDFSRVNHSFDLTDLVEGRVDAVHSYNTDEPYELINSDVPHHIIYPSSYGIDFYGDGLFTCGRMVREAPEVVDAFLDASLEGWRYAMNHSEEVVDLILQQYKCDMSRDHLLYEASAMKGLIMPNLVEVGHMNPGRWQHIAETLDRLGFMPDGYDLEGFLYSRAPRTVDLRKLLAVGAVVALVLAGTVFSLIVLASYNRRLRAMIDMQHKTEIALRQSERLFRSFFDVGLIGMAILSPRGRFLFVNDRLCFMLGYTSEELQRKRWSDLQDCEHEAAGQAAFDRIVCGEVHTLEIRLPLLHQEGGLIYTDLYLSALRSEEGQLKKIILHIQDVTRSHMIEQVRRESEEKYRIIFEASSEGIVLLSDVVFDCNDQACRLCGWSRSEVIGHSLTQLSPPIQPDGRFSGRLMAHFIEQARLGIPQIFEWQLRQKNGEVLDVEISLKTVALGGRSCLLGVWRDITDRKQTEQDVRRINGLLNRRAKELEQSQNIILGMMEDAGETREQLEQANIQLERAIEKANKMAVESEMANAMKSEFLANMSHDIRTPMNAILGFAELLNRHTEDPEVQGYVSAIRSSGKTLLRLINDILDLSKIEAGKLELEYRPFNPYALLEEIRQVFMWVITEKGLTLEEEVETDLPKEIMLDEIRLRQVLLNLVGNAVKFTSRGGICIRVRHERSADEAGKVDVIIVIEDSGSGIPADQLDMIFNAFQQSEQERKLKSGGSGLGLAISKRLVEMMGGEISVTSEKGKGSAFKVVLKGVEVGEGDGLMMAGSKAQEIQFEPGRVLVVDDVSYNRLLFRHYLRDVGLEIEEAEGGREALNKLKSMDEIPALILLDIKMPEIDGYAVMKRVKRDKRFKDVPIVVFTASATPEEERQVYLAGGDGFLKKPVSREALLDELGRHLPHQLHDVAPSASPVGMYRETANWEDTLRNVKNTESWSSFVEQVSGPGREQWERVSKTYIMDDVAALAEWAEDLAGRLGVSLLADWAVVLKKQANVFDVAAVVQTLACYGTLMEVVRKLTEEET